MAEISAKAVKELRDRTGAGMMECKKALTEAGGDVDKAVTVLRERGLAKAGKRQGRETSEGTVALATNGSAGGMVEIGCETDFVARTDDFQNLAAALAGVVAAEAGVDSPEALAGAVLDGEKVGDRVTAAISKLGENVVLKRVHRMAIDGPGLVGGYVHAGGKLGVLVGLASEGSTDALGAVAKDLAMHVAAVDPSPIAVDRDAVPADAVAAERELFTKQALASGKPEKVVERIVEGRLGKFFSEICLVEQAFVKDPDRTISDVLKAAGEEAGAGVSVTGYVRFKLGETSDS